MKTGLHFERPIEALIQEAKELLLSNSGYHKAMKISEKIMAYENDCIRQKDDYALEKLKSSCLQVIRLFINVLDKKDECTKEHCERVTEIALHIGRVLGFSKENLLYLEFAGLLHDIGKIAIPGKIINKEDKLTEQEYELVKLHPYIGYRLMKDIEFLAPSSKILLQHHERIDGKGYPMGLKGNEIEAGARILAVADAYDAMTSSRPYRKVQMTAKEAVIEMERSKGTHFDSESAQVLMELIGEGIVA